MTKKVYRRNVEQLMGDCLWPGGGLGGPDPLQQRMQAIAEVLCHMPERDYERLRAVFDSFTWFIPHYHTYGWIEPIFATIFDETSDLGFEYAPHVKLLYLSPRLEERAWDIVVAVVAHELAHLVLDHKVLVRPGSEEDEAQEEEAFNLLCEWGFEREAKKHRAMHKRRESWEETMVRKLLEEQERS